MILIMKVVMMMGRIPVVEYTAIGVFISVPVLWIISLILGVIEKRKEKKEMGKEFVIDNLEDMCNLMCNNQVPERQEKLCDTCIYRSKYEWEKPCIIYKEDCELYKKVGEDNIKASDTL